MHLFNFGEDQIDYFAPESITQNGIQKILGCNKSHVCRIIKKNEEKKYIYRKKMKVEDHKRRLEVFFLTEDGREYVLKMKNSLTRINRENKQ